MRICACLKEAVAEELPSPAEELCGEDDLPRAREPEALGEGAAGGPGAEEEEPRERARAAGDGDVDRGVGESQRERRVQRQEVEDEEVGEEDGPGQQRVHRRVHRVRCCDLKKANCASRSSTLRGWGSCSVASTIGASPRLRKMWD
jgi:hypothetical protein